MHHRNVLSIIVTVLTLSLTVGCGLEEADVADPGTDGGAAWADVPSDSDAGPLCTSDEECAEGEVCTEEGCLPAEEPAEPAVAPAPVSASADCTAAGCTCTLHFGIAYISEATCGEARGTMPGMTWSSGALISDVDGNAADLEMVVPAASAVPGTYEMSYLGFQSCGAPTPEAWAQYGGSAQLLLMSPDAREFISCNWWDASSGAPVATGSPSCSLRVEVSVVTQEDGTLDCMFAPAGNMRDYHE